jgi:hypothetical protein
LFVAVRTGHLNAFDSLVNKDASLYQLDDLSFGYWSPPFSDDTRSSSGGSSLDSVALCHPRYDNQVAEDKGTILMRSFYNLFP